MNIGQNPEVAARNARLVLHVLADQPLKAFVIDNRMSEAAARMALSRLGISKHYLTAAEWQDVQTRRKIITTCSSGLTDRPTGRPIKLEARGQTDGGKAA